MKSKNKRLKQWVEIKQKLIEMFLEKGITKCEVCNSKHYVIAYSFHHKRPRKDYYNNPDKLGDFNEVLLLCNTCHDMATKDKRLSNEWFKKLRNT